MVKYYKASEIVSEIKDPVIVVELDKTELSDIAPFICNVMEVILYNKNNIDFERIDFTSLKGYPLTYSAPFGNFEIFPILERLNKEKVSFALLPPDDYSLMDEYIKIIKVLLYFYVFNKEISIDIYPATKCFAEAVRLHHKIPVPECEIEYIFGHEYLKRKNELIHEALHLVNVLKKQKLL